MLREVVQSARALTGARYGVIVTVDEAGRPRPQDTIIAGVPPAEERQVAERPDAMRLACASRNVCRLSYREQIHQHPYHNGEDGEPTGGLPVNLEHQHCSGSIRAELVQLPLNSASLRQRLMQICPVVARGQSGAASH